MCYLYSSKILKGIIRRSFTREDLRAFLSSCSFKLQALIDLRGHQDLEVQVHAVALTYDQVCEFDLPSTPLKEDEKRAGAWKEAWNREQTEIDALATLQPEVLRQRSEEHTSELQSRGH